MLALLPSPISLLQPEKSVDGMEHVHIQSGTRSAVRLFTFSQRSPTSSIQRLGQQHGSGRGRHRGNLSYQSYQ